MNALLKKFRFSTWRIILVGFLVAVLTGTLLLMLPFASRMEGGASFTDALFTATSAVCVTGLIVQDTATYWTVFGQAVILILIQIGGMGIITVAVFIARLSGRKIGLMQRSTMQNSISAHKVGGIVRLTNFILKIAISIELIGAALMAPVFIRDFGPLKGIWYALFHSISAFCNAGFDLMGVREPFSSLTSYTGSATINITILLLIVIGGIGFLTWEDIKTHRLRFGRYRLQSKVILVTSALLIAVPTLYFYCYEFTAAAWPDLPEGERFWAALFQAVTPRTAGYNTVDLTQMSEPSLMITILLMLIGGSPGSTAGGMKTTTLAVLVASSFAVFRQKTDTNCFNRRIADDIVRTAATVLMLYLVLCLCGGILISCIEHLPILTCLFEAASAIGTVGLTLGITPQLSLVSQGILIILMFMGRVGSLTIVFAAVSGRRTNLSRLPQEKITVG